MVWEMNPAIKGVSKKQQLAILASERKRRASGDWGDWEVLTFPPCSISPDGWPATITTAHRNKVFSVLDRMDVTGIRHLAVSSLSGIRPTWPEMQRIKDDLAGNDATAIEVYPPNHQVIDQADMYHIWVLRGKLPFGLHLENRLPGLRTPVEIFK